MLFGRAKNNITKINKDSKQFLDIQKYIDDNFIDMDLQVCGQQPEIDGDFPYFQNPMADEDEFGSTPIEAPPQAKPAMAEPVYIGDNQNLSKILNVLDESFSEMLLHKIDEQGIKDSECYKKANVDRKLFSKIRSNKNYRPSKQTAIAFCIALELNLDEAQDMLLKAGFALSHSNKFDVIVEYFIKNKKYNIFEINEALYTFDQPLLG